MAKLLRLTNGEKHDFRMASVSILGHVELPFDIAGVRCYIDAIIVDELDADCLIGADFMRKFDAVLWPREATLSIEDGKERVPLQLSTLDEEGWGPFTSTPLALLTWMRPRKS